MQAGKLRHRVTIQALTGSYDSLGEPVDSWQTVGSVWAAVMPRSATEATKAERTQATVSHQVRIRYRDGIGPQMRLLYGGRVLHIVGVVNVDERNRELVLECTEVVD